MFTILCSIGFTDQSSNRIEIPSRQELSGAAYG